MSKTDSVYNDTKILNFTLVNLTDKLTCIPIYIQIKNICQTSYSRTSMYNN